jgi:hypothetical protein
MQQHMCDAFYAAGRTQDASESLLKMVNTLDDAVYMSGPLIKWVSGEFMFNPFDYRAFEPLRIDCTHRYLSAPECDSEMISNSAQHREMLSLTPLLREWAKTTLAVSEWKDALVAAASVSISFCSGTPLSIDRVLVCSSHFQGSQSIGSYVNA